MHDAYQDKKLVIFEAWADHKITTEQREFLLTKLDEGYFEESIKDAAKSAKQVITHPKSEESKQILNRAADKYNAGMNKRATFVAKKIVRDPTKGGKKDVSAEVYEKYKRDMLKWRTAYKVGEILATGAIAIGPIDTVIKIATATAMARSSDPVDQATMALMNKLKDKALSIKDKLKGLVDKVRGKKINEGQLKSEISSLDNATSAVAKETDVVKNRKEKSSGSNSGKPVTVNESVYQKIDNFLTLCGEKNKHRALELIIEYTDFNRVDMLPVISYYTGI